MPRCIALLAPLLISLPADAAIRSVTTRSTIIGTLPYFTVDNGVTKSADPSILHAITLSDGRVFSPTNNPSTPTNPIELPGETKTAADIEMFMPADKTTISLNELIAAPYNYGGDDEGDSLTATGSLTLEIWDEIFFRKKKRNEELDPCNRYYKITLSNPNGRLTTQYGNPKNVNFDSLSTTYYVKPMSHKPHVCFAASERIDEPDRQNFNGPESQWIRGKGFIPQNIDQPATNFPTVGAHGLYFNLTVAGVAGNVFNSLSYDKSPINSGIDITIIGYANNTVEKPGNSNVVRISLTGPRYNTNNATTAVPTTFTLYADRAKTKKIYSFTIGKWFIPTPGYTINGYDANYCVERYGPGFRIPSIADYTNANGDGWTGGLTGQPNNYQRRIGGGLFAEWGSTENDLYYKDSDFDFYESWAVETREGPIGQEQHKVLFTSGGISSYVGTAKHTRHTCVTP